MSPRQEAFLIGIIVTLVVIGMSIAVIYHWYTLGTLVPMLGAGALSLMVLFRSLK